MITAIIGKNNFVMQAERQRLVHGYIEHHGDLGLEVIDCQEIEPKLVYDSVTNLPFLVDKKLVVLRSPSANKALCESLPEWLSAPDEAIEVLVLEPNIDKRLSWYKWLVRNAKVITAEPLNERDLPGWLQTYTKQLGVAVDPAASRLLIARAGTSQEQLARELEKLALDGQPITAAKVESLVEPLPADTVFEMLDDLARQQTAAALERLERLKLQKVDPAEVLGLITWQLTVWAKLLTAQRSRADDLAVATKLHPFVVQKNMPVVRRLSLGQFNLMLDGALEAERSIKWRGAPAGPVVEQLILSLGEVMSA